MRMLARLRLRDRFARWSGPDMLGAAQRIFLLFAIVNGVMLVPHALVLRLGAFGVALLAGAVATAARVWEYRRGRPVPIWCDAVETVMLGAVALATGTEDAVIGVLFTATQARAVLSGSGRLAVLVASSALVVAAPALAAGRPVDSQKAIGLVAAPAVVYVLRILLLHGQAEHRNQRLLLEAVLRRLPSAVIVVDATGAVLLANHAAAEVTGWRETRGAGRRLDDLVLVDPAGRRLGVGEILERTADAHEVRDAVATLVHEDGSRRWVAFSAEPLADRTGAVIVVQDVTAQRRYEERLHHLATHDPLTGLPNRALFRERLEAAAFGTGYAVLLVDLNDFKRVNDTLGHAAGDSLLRAVADRLVHRAGPRATVARLGGDEFAVLVADCDPAAAERVLAAVSGAFEEPFAIAGGGWRCGGAVGLAMGGPGRAPLDVLAEADLAMYAHKPDAKVTLGRAGTPRPRPPRRPG